MSGFDWKDLGKTIIKAGAPLLGAAIGGPGGAALGASLAAVFGGDADNPAELAAAIAGNPEAAVRLREIEANTRVQLEQLRTQQAIVEMQEESKQIESVNQTMREEGKSEHWAQWLWRPYWGFVSATAFLVVAIFVCYLGYQAIIKGQTEALRMIPELVTAVAFLFGIPATILGVASWHRGVAKRIQAGDTSIGTLALLRKSDKG